MWKGVMFTQPDYTCCQKWPRLFPTASFFFLYCVKVCLMKMVPGLGQKKKFAFFTVHLNVWSFWWFSVVLDRSLPPNFLGFTSPSAILPWRPTLNSMLLPGLVQIMVQWMCSLFFVYLRSTPDLSWEYVYRTTVFDYPPHSVLRGNWMLARISVWNWQWYRCWISAGVSLKSEHDLFLCMCTQTRPWFILAFRKSKQWE
jgi:hypothetical protein